MHQQEKINKKELTNIIKNPNFRNDHYLAQKKTEKEYECQYEK